MLTEHTRVSNPVLKSHFRLNILNLVLKLAVLDYALHFTVLIVRSYNTYTNLFLLCSSIAYQ